jgi:hypothetical protein
MRNASTKERIADLSMQARLRASAGSTELSRVTRAYRRMARECHPDKGGDRHDFEQLTRAKEKMVEQAKRSEQLLAQARGEQQEKAT